MLLPTADTALNKSINFTEQTSNTFFYNLDLKTVFGFVNNLEAMKQAIYLILSIERYKYVILPWSYGIELEDLYGMPISWVIPETKRRIEEALLQDTRIRAVKDFDFQTAKNKLIVTFTVETIFGDIPIERAVGF